MSENQEESKIPRHIAVIMDGNGRWAKKKGAMRIFGHNNAIEAVRDITEGCAALGVEHLTLYAFSTENWSRPQIEVDGLMSLLITTINGELPTLMKNNVRLTAIGNIEGLLNGVNKKLLRAIEQTAANTGLNLILALNYSGKWDLTQALKSIAKDVKDDKIQIDDLTEALITTRLSTSNIPDPELLIRTSGEMRISNFLLWQLAYSELYFTNVLWPDFRKSHLNDAINDYNCRERRFGKTSEQINA
ncbi:MAG: isoprenyl transferase [Flammeovirgaceae bacterium]|jgi:undecaprenyl diphosphate synthase|nr:isoprenyl transferase [Flammeovirgaceae bacterium]|tara:strand:+ start:118949 stop:119686 length:738 start_codon:yes stop_codon:yes gene_type:complete